MSYVTISKEHYEKLVHYVDLEEQLEKLYGDRLTLDDVVNNLNRIVQNGEEKLDFARILTNTEAEKWDKWKDLEEQGRLKVLDKQHCDWCDKGAELCGTCRKFFDYHNDGGSDKCSAECKEGACLNYEPMNYCPNCGVKMEGSKW